jgi:hypothetical protein
MQKADAVGTPAVKVTVVAPFGGDTGGGARASAGSAPAVTAARRREILVQLAQERSASRGFASERERAHLELGGGSEERGQLGH